MANSILNVYCSIMKKTNCSDFIQTVWDYYSKHRRSMPWRENVSPYYIFLSEMMLQQTQVGRVEQKFKEFTDVLPSFNDLASADFATVLGLWSGLGYNRRARYLYESAKLICSKFNGTLPNSLTDLESLPGIGKATASAILTYAYNIPIPYIETNIRTVFIYHFYSDSSRVPDKDILILAEQTLDMENPREWHWALMDYGSFLKKNYGNLNKKSKTYVKQSKFQGSDRQKRGEILRVLLKAPLREYELLEELNEPRVLVHKLLEELIRENIVAEENGTYKIAEK